MIQKIKRHLKEKGTFRDERANRSASDLKEALSSKVTFPVILKSKKTTKNRVSRVMFTMHPTMLVKSLKTGPKTMDDSENSSRSLSSCPRLNKLV